MFQDLMITVRTMDTRGRELSVKTRHHLFDNTSDNVQEFIEDDSYKERIYHSVNHWHICTEVVKIEFQPAEDYFSLAYLAKNIPATAFAKLWQKMLANHE